MNGHVHTCLDPHLHLAPHTHTPQKQWRSTCANQSPHLHIARRPCCDGRQAQPLLQRLQVRGVELVHDKVRGRQGHSQQAQQASGEEAVVLQPEHVARVVAVPGGAVQVLQVRGRRDLQVGGIQLC